MRESWRELARLFSDEARQYPELRHNLIEVTDAPGFELEGLDESAEYMQLARTMNDPAICLARGKTPKVVHPIYCFHRGCEHLFHGEIGAGNAEGWRRFRELAEIGAHLAIEEKLVRPKPMIPTPAALIAKDFETATWMELVYSLARRNLPGILRATTSEYWNEQPMPDGVTASSLGVGVFQASAYAAGCLADLYELAHSAVESPTKTIGEESFDPRHGHSRQAPEIDQVRLLRDRLQAFLNKSRSTCGICFMEESDFLPSFSGLSDALRPLRSIPAEVEGWPHRIFRALPAIVEEFDAVTREWGWERLAEPEPRRSAYVAERQAWFASEVARPVYEAAISWQAGFRGLDFPSDVEKWADEGRKLGYKPILTHEEGQARFRLAHDRWYIEPRFGTVSPKLEDSAYDLLCRAFNLLDSALKQMSAENPSRFMASAATDSDLPGRSATGEGIQLLAAGMKPEPSPMLSRDSLTDEGFDDSTMPPLNSDRASARTTVGVPTEMEANPSASPWQALVTLDQAAAMVHRSKRTLERHKTRGTLPAPAVEGGGGRADLYEWTILRPWLTGEFGIQLPDRYPTRRES